MFLAIVLGALIVGAAIYFSPEKSEKSPEIYRGQTPVNACGNVPELPDGAVKLATKIIDGDTFLIEGGYSVRLLGIDADERSYPCYDEAKKRLEELILNQEVLLVKGGEDKDQWCRYLRYPFLKWSSSGSEEYRNIGLTLLEDGLVIARLSPENVRYGQEFSQAEKEAKGNKTGCKWSVSDKAPAGQSSTGKTEFSWDKLTQELTGLKVIGACQAGNYYGKETIVEGKVADGYRSKTNTVFLNFEKPYPNQCFTAVIFSSVQYKFVQTPEKYYTDKTVRVRGEIKEYQGKPEIILEDPSQIEIGK